MAFEDLLNGRFLVAEVRGITGGLTLKIYAYRFLTEREVDATYAAFLKGNRRGIYAEKKFAMMLTNHRP